MNKFELNLKKYFRPYKYKLINSLFIKGKELKVLDVGCGARARDIANFSMKLKCFDGVDNQIWHDDQESYSGIDTFYDIDLETQDLSLIPDGYYDVIIVSHLIEHINNGEIVINSLCAKLNIGGVIYIETPSPRTFNLPSAIGFANFYDDKTHKRMYFPHEIINVLVRPGFQVLKFGIRRDPIRMFIFSPIMIFLNALYYLPIRRKANFKGLWDLFGVAQFWCARRLK